MAVHHDWLQVTLDLNNRRGLAEGVEAGSGSSDPDERTRLLRVLRSSRDELLLDRNQAQLVLDALGPGQMSALRARLEAFLGLR